MNEIKCPKCGTVFQINEEDYESISKQIRDMEFNKELDLHKKQYEQDKENAIKLLKASNEKELSDKLNDKDKEINNLENELKNLSSKLEKDYLERLNKKELEIKELSNKIEVSESKKELEITKVLSEKDKEINNLNNLLDSNNKEYKLKENSLKEQYENKLKDKDEQIAYYKDFKARQSTKMVGESLEVHCNNEFNRLRPLFPNAYFDKDNEVKEGSKGDFIFRDFDDDGNEIVSIMFEMKNENDTTSTKHKNEDFLKELDKDRKLKNCEYAVLVSLLEMDNDLYNDGIVDVSHLYPKMYVIRPQFFIPLITLIRNISSKALEYKKELNIIRNQNIDITNFENDLNSFKDTFGRNWRLANEKFGKAIEEIDKTIEHLQKVKENLLRTDDNLRIANNKLDNLTVQKLTRNNETMKKKFDELKD